MIDYTSAKLCKEVEHVWVFILEWTKHCSFITVNILIIHCLLERLSRGY